MEGSGSWLKVERLTKTAWRIVDAGMVSEYLLVGDEKALLVDGGWGIGDLAAAVARLTSLPLTVVNTHGHRDHTSGDYQFSGSVHIHEADVPLLKASYDPKARGETLRRFPRETWPPGFDEQAWIHAPLPPYTTFSGPLRFDLGGRTVDVIETPGHTPGSVCVYDRKERLLLSGDNILARDTLLMLPDSLPLTTYLGSVGQLTAIADKIDHIYPAHGPAPLKPAVLNEMENGVRKILNGAIKGRPESTFLGSGLSCQFDGCGILYREDRLR